MPKVELERNAITIAVDNNNNTVNVTYNDGDRMKNLRTCVLGLGVLYNRCVEAGIPEEEINQAMMSGFLGAVVDFKSDKLFLG